MSKKILDVCCGGRMFWFDKHHPDTLYVDRRRLAKVKLSNGQNFEIAPDEIMDFRNLDLPDNRFNLVVYDPPHLKGAGKNGWMAVKYGSLGTEWREDLRRGFNECFRVLKPDGVLIFKWNETVIPLSEVLKLTAQKPLFGHPSGLRQKTHWVCFMK